MVDWLKNIVQQNLMPDENAVPFGICVHTPDHRKPGNFREVFLVEPSI
jgi:hypothetical protein